MLIDKIYPMEVLHAKVCKKFNFLFKDCYILFI